LKRIGEEETGYFKAFSLDLKEVVFGNETFGKPIT